MPSSSPLSRLRLGHAGIAGTPSHHLSVDGMTPAGPNLSHWPGNRTPKQWRADLSTGIALQFARATDAEQTQFLAGAEVVLNDHYDTDGFGALLAVLRPDVASAREELLLLGAATGDYGTWQTARAFAIDRIVAGLAGANSPLQSLFAGLDAAQRSHRRYAFLIEHAEQVLDHPATLGSIYLDELAQVQLELDRGRRGAVERTLHRQLGFAVLHTRGSVQRMTLNTLAGAYRVLHVDRRQDGVRYRFHDRTESWFELVTIQPSARRDLRPLSARLNELERSTDAARWCADAPDEPIPELYFGLPSAQEYGAVSRELWPSRLSPDTVAREFTALFAADAGGAP